MIERSTLSSRQEKKQPVLLVHRKNSCYLIHFAAVALPAIFFFPDSSFKWLENKVSVWKLDPASSLCCELPGCHFTQFLPDVRLIANGASAVKTPEAIFVRGATVLKGSSGLYVWSSFPALQHSQLGTWMVLFRGESGPTAQTRKWKTWRWGRETFESKRFPLGPKGFL